MGLINAVGGGTLATAIVFVFPTLMYRQAVHKKPFDEEDLEEGEEEIERPTLAQKREVTFSMALMWAGIAMGLIGVVMALTNEEQHYTASRSTVGSNHTVAL